MGALHAHCTHQRRRLEISIRQRGVLEESSSDSERRSHLLPTSWQQGQAHPNQNRKRCQCGDRSLTEHGKLQSTKHCCRVPYGSLCCRARPCTTQDSSRSRVYIERSSQKSRKTFIGYRSAVNLFVQSCKKTYFHEIRRDDMLDYLFRLRKCVSPKTGRRFGESKDHGLPQ